jgi:hypothetical protein
MSFDNTSIHYGKLRIHQMKTRFTHDQPCSQHITSLLQSFDAIPTAAGDARGFERLLKGASQTAAGVWHLRD